MYHTVAFEIHLHEVISFVMKTSHLRQHGQLVGALDMKSGKPEVKSRTDRQLICSSSTPWLRLFSDNWSASCQLGFFTCLVHLMCSVAICIISPHQPNGCQ